MYLLRSGVPWQMLPLEMGCGSGSTCWRRLVRWQRAGVWQRLHETPLAELRPRGRLDQRWTVIDSASLRALRGGKLDRTQPIAARRARNTAPNSNDGRRAQGITTVVARPRSPHGSGLGQLRWVVERTLAWLHRFRRVNVRYERRADVHEAFLSLGCALIAWNYLKSPEPVF